ncbi:PQQ-dependent sugar dehydrogenase [Spirosoma utsteinense]|uniref:Glucose/arabinose dehydrogenase n=1 Tax=Spirosoma utsteinense TaxID=2585773 RepID=A0ABR6W922_9BACT|nr:PQQ-dependent sugar dehydrogenase [Spirosoma utsteinense]MBC3787378.1 glucose/arabinose dehydrogenase [Spirosoma utsteinense]MBC3793068.1 glucose/arabinose dehydrogenase [Spirosoma utsteinense]
MLKYTIGAAFVGVFCLSSFLIEPKPAAKTARENYETYCSSCHGEKVEAFVDRKWKHGTQKSELMKSISGGYADLGMPAWKEVLNDKEIDEMADLILTSLKNVDQYKFASKPTSNVFASEGMTVRLDTVASGLSSPWGLAFLPDGGMLVTDRAGDVYRIDKTNRKTKLTGGPSVLAEGQGGLLDVELHPDFAKNQLIYLSYSAFKTVGADTLSTTAVMRARLSGDALTDQKIIFEALPYAKTRHHYGSRLEFDKKGFLYISVGDRGNEKENPQSLASDCGKVHRLHDDGRIPADNPFMNEKKGRTSIYSYGHRNPQGMAMHPATGAIWTHEHGPRGGDEVNIIKKSANYGWPVICYGINYDGKPITNLTAKAGMEQPMIYWLPSIGPSGMAFVEGSKYPGWKDNLMVGSLRFQYLNRCVVKDNKIVSQENILKNIGRLRNIDMGPDGYLYVSVEEPGYVFRLMPMNQ